MANSDSTSNSKKLLSQSIILSIAICAMTGVLILVLVFQELDQSQKSKKKLSSEGYASCGCSKKAK